MCSGAATGCRCARPSNWPAARGCGPILMTSLTTMLGLLPMALAIGEGSEIQAPLARVVIGGLVTSTVITLVFVPTVYTLFEEGWTGLKRGVHHEAPASESGD